MLSTHLYFIYTYNQKSHIFLKGSNLQTVPYTTPLILRYLMWIEKNDIIKKTTDTEKRIKQTTRDERRVMGKNGENTGKISWRTRTWIRDAWMKHQLFFFFDSPLLFHENNVSVCICCRTDLFHVVGL